MAETVSAILSVYNGEKYLGETLESMLAQTVPLHEIIVVDDGSTDGSAALARSFGAGVRVVSQANAGQSAGLAHGMALASGTCFAFNDADDLWAPHKQEWQLAALTADPALDLVYGLCEQFVSPELGEEEQRRYAPPTAILPGALLQASTIRRRAFERTGNIDPTLRGAGAPDWLARSVEAGVTRHFRPQERYPRPPARTLLAVLRSNIRRNARGQ